MSFQLIINCMVLNHDVCNILPYTLAATIVEISGIDKIAGTQSSSIILGAIIRALVPIISDSFQTYNCLRFKIRPFVLFFSTDVCLSSRLTNHAFIHIRNNNHTCIACIPFKHRRRTYNRELDAIVQFPYYAA